MVGDFESVARSALSLTICTVFFVAAASKVRQLGLMATAVGQYVRSIPTSIANLLARLIVATEAGIAIGMIFQSTQRYACFGAATLLAVLTGAMIWHIMAGRRFACNCFGTSDEPIGWAAVARNGLLFGGSVAVATSQPSPVLTTGSLEVAVAEVVGMISFLTILAAISWAHVLIGTTPR